MRRRAGGQVPAKMWYGDEMSEIPQVGDLLILPTPKDGFVPSGWTMTDDGMMYRLVDGTETEVTAGGVIHHLSSIPFARLVKDNSGS